VSTNNKSFQEIAALLLPAGVKPIYERPKNGDRAAFDFEYGVIHAPEPVNNQALWDFSHECAHARLHWDRPGRRMQPEFASAPRHVTEYECERWTFYRFRDAKFLSNDMIKQSSAYLMREIMLDLEAILCCGLYQPAIDYLLSNHHQEVERRFEEHIRKSSFGLVGWNSIEKLIETFTPEEELMRPPN
jgi:hypothetical protein